jgi:hypothetical protein
MIALIVAGTLKQFEHGDLFESPRRFRAPSTFQIGSMSNVRVFEGIRIQRVTSKYHPEWEARREMPWSHTEWLRQQ